MKIGIIGSGRIGGLIGTLWAKAGHEVLFSSRHPESLADLVRAAGATASLGTPDQAIEFGDVILLSTPFGYLPEFGRTNREALGQKIVLETGNPNIARDGSLAQEVIESGQGTGIYLRQWLPGVRVVRAFNTVWDPVLAKEAHRAEPRVGIPLASDDEEALRIASQLVIDAGFDPVMVGTLDQSRRFDVGTPVYDTGMSGPEVRQTLGLLPASSGATTPMQKTFESETELLRRIYAAFNARDIDAALTAMTADVAWPKAFKGGFVRGPEEIRAYWTEQWSEINPNVEPTAFYPQEDGSILVDVHQAVRDLDGAVLADVHVGHLYTFEQGLIAKMEVTSLPPS